MAAGTLNLLAQGENVATDTVNTTQEALRDTLHEAFTPIIALAPKAIAAVVIVVVGYILARVLAKVVTTLCEKVGLQTAADRSGLAESMNQAGIKHNVPGIVGVIVFWLLMSVALMTGFRVLGLQVVSDVMQGVVNYIPNLLVATVIVVVGLLVASFIRGVVATSADRVGITYGEQLAAGCYYVLALMTFVAAFNQLNITFPMLEDVVKITFAGLALGFGLAFGLGGRDVMSGILSGYYIRQRFQSGDKVTLGPMSGTVREVGPVATIIESYEEGLLHRHSIPNNVMLKEAVR